MTSAETDDGVGGSESMASVAPFVKKCYDMVDDESTDDIISWSDTNDCFVIWDITQFTVRLLPLYFKHKNFSSFMRQLNIYGFRKIDSDSWIFGNDGFLRGQKHLLKNISRKKTSQVPEQRRALEQKENCPDESSEKDKNELRKQVENLKIDRITLSREVVELKQHHESSENKLVGLRKRIQGMETSQQQMMSFLVMALQYPGYLAKVLQPKENNWRVAKARKVIEEGSEDDKSMASDGMVVRYRRRPANEASNPEFTPTLASEKPNESNACPAAMEDIFSDSDFMKFLMDKSICPLENESLFALPEWIDDGSWEQLLLSSPFRESIEQTKEDGEETVDTEMDVEMALSRTPFAKSPNSESELTVHEANLGKSQS